MFALLRKNTIGLFGVPRPVKVVVKNTLVEEKDVHYWHNYAKNLENAHNEVLNSNDTLRKIALERRANIAGHRAIIKVLLKEINKFDTNSPVLDNSARDAYFQKIVSTELNNIARLNNLTPWKRLRPDEMISE